MKSSLVLVSIFISLMIIGACGISKRNSTANNAPALASLKIPTRSNSIKNESTKMLKLSEKPASNTKYNAIPENKRVAVPQEWLVVYDENRGYEFRVPEGTKEEWQSFDDTEIYIANLPVPTKVTLMVAAYKDEDTEKATILKKAQKILETLDQRNIQFNETKQEITRNYYIVKFSAVDEKNSIIKGKLLVGLDKTDNFLMFVTSPEANFKANEKIIDEIWSNFQMHAANLNSNS